MEKMKDEIIELPKGLLGDEIHICTLQLKSPFWDEVQDIAMGLEKNCIGWGGEALKTRNKKIKTLLDELSGAITKNGERIDIIVFPEYAIEKSMLYLLETFSKKHRTIIVAGYYDFDERQSIAHIIVPNSNKIKDYKQYKLTKSKYDKKYLSDVEGENKKYYRFIWNSDKNKTEQNCLHVFVCLDFLSKSIDVVDRSKAGLIIVPMCSPKIEAFYGLSEYFMRSAEGNDSIVVSLCNSTDMQNQLNSIKACGESQIVGPYGEKQSVKLHKSTEGGIIAKIKLNSVLTVPTRFRNDEVISSMRTFLIENDGKIKDFIQPDVQNIVINPNVIIKCLGLCKIYVFYNVKEYYDFRQHIQKIYLPMQGNGIFGVHDILFQGYEENWDFFELRLMNYLGPKYTDLISTEKKSPEHYEITDILKFRGKMLMDISDKKFCPIGSYYELSGDYLEKNLKNIRGVFLGKDIGQNLIKEFEDYEIIFKANSNSDITHEEKETGFEEYLLFLFLYSSGQKSITTVMEEFQSYILPTLMSDNRIRTIEFSREQSYGINYPKGTYILHVVGKLDDLRNIILNHIHKPLYEKKITCGTRAVPTADNLSNEEYLSLNETILYDPALRRTVHDIIYYLKYSNRFIIKQLPLITINKIVQFYSKYKAYVKRTADSRGTATSHNQISETLDKLDQYIYGFGDAYINYGQLNEENFETLRGRCSGTYNSLSIEVESILNKTREYILRIVNNLDDTTKMKYHTRFKKEDVFLNTKQTILGKLAIEIYKWNTKIAEEEHKILDESFTEAVGKLQTIVPYRNYFSHAFIDSIELRNKKASDFANELLNNTVIAFDFVSTYNLQVEQLYNHNNSES